MARGIEGKKTRPWLVGTIALLALSGGLVGCSDRDLGAIPFLPNSFAFWDDPANWTTSYGPAYADILVESTNFLPCKGGPIALCYYSGPEPAPCTVTEDGRFADCECYAIPYGPYYVDINSILNHEIYQQTIAVCGTGGELCAGQTNMAPVCAAINAGEFLPGADMISTFSFACAPEQGIGQTACSTSLYAGCMTASCAATADAGIVDCQCPTYEGPFQIGNFGAACALSSGFAWSAAYNPTEGGTTYPQPPGCVPDAPGEAGCPLLERGNVPPPPPGIVCDDVCNEYASCRNGDGIEVGYTCDATLCTSTCGDENLVRVACDGLSSCDVTAIIALESAMGCSCCASQICGCTPTAATDAEISRLNALQEEQGIETQCQQNGTLCGS